MKPKPSPPPERPTAPDHVLHIGTHPLSRAKLRGLRAVGVEVSSLSPTRVWEALLDVAEREGMVKRLREAEVCALDEGTHLSLATAIFTLRQAECRTTLTTMSSIAHAGVGMSLGQCLAGQQDEQHKWVHEVGTGNSLSQALRQYGARSFITTPPVAPLEGPIIRPPLPLPYMVDPTAYTEVEIREDNEGDRNALRFGRGPSNLGVLLEKDAASRFSGGSASDALEFLFKHLPSEDLHRLHGPGVRGWWGRLANVLTTQAPTGWERLDDLGEWSEEVESLFLHALARDEGRLTLSAMPDVLEPLRREVTARWEQSVAAITKRLPTDMVELRNRGAGDTTTEMIAARWGVVPLDDPMGADADPNLFQPTLETFRAARRYRPAGEVVLGAREHWGGRPYLEHTGRQHLEAFVLESEPTKATELEAWIRALRVIPKGRMRDAIMRGMMWWRRIEIELLEAWPEGEDTKPLVSKIPCFGDDGRLQEGVLERITNDAVRMRIGGREKMTRRDFSF